jgi:hypothetical protein
LVSAANGNINRTVHTTAEVAVFYLRLLLTGITDEGQTKCFPKPLPRAVSR